MKLGWFLVVSSGIYLLWGWVSALTSLLSGYHVDTGQLVYYSTLGVPFLLWGIIRLRRKKEVNQDARK